MDLLDMRHADMEEAVVKVGKSEGEFSELDGVDVMRDP